jgi:hypothetical protein
MLANMTSYMPSPSPRISPVVLAIERTVIHHLVQAAFQLFFSMVATLIRNW